MKKINVVMPSMPPYEKYIEKIKRLWETKHLTSGGEFHVELKKGLKEYLEVDEVSLLVNGHFALEMAIKGLDLKGEIITTPFTFVSTAHGIVNCGCTPVFCDINREDYNIDPRKIEELITEKTVGIIPVHIFGNPCNVEEIERIAKKYKLKVIYDAAQSFGVKINGVGIGNFGDASAFSLNATKVMHSVEGGAVTYKDKEIGKRIALLKNFGISSQSEVSEIGYNGKMNELSAAMGVINLEEVDSYIEKRKNIATIYREELKDVKGLKVLDEKEGVKYNYAYFPILVLHEEIKVNRDILHDELNKEGIFPRKYFHPLVPDFKCYKDNYYSENLVNAKYVSERVLTLPLYSDLSEEDAREICRLIKEIVR